MSVELEPTPGPEEQQAEPTGDQPPPFPMPIERRRETRCAINDRVEMWMLDSAGSSRLAGTVLDVSWKGLRVEVRTPVNQGARVEILLPDRAIVFGETRYCRQASDLYHIGIAIEDVCYGWPLSIQHIHAEQLGLYLVGKGLTVAETVHIKNHLVACETCRTRMPEADGRLPQD